MFVENISESLSWFQLEEIWCSARSTLFLEWFTEITKSVDRMICKDTEWTLLNAVIKRCFLPYFWTSYLKDYLQLHMAKIKFLIRMEGSVHYIAYKTSIHLCEKKLIPNLIIFPHECAMLTEILREFEISIEHYVEQELTKEPIDQFGWSKKALMNVFLRDNYAGHHMYYFHRNQSMSNSCQNCNSPEPFIPNSWLNYLKILKMKKDPNDLYQSHRPVTYDNKKLIHYEEDFDDSNTDMNNCDDDSPNVRKNRNVAKDEESYNPENVREKTYEEFLEVDEEFYKESHEESVEQSEIWYCFECAEKIFYASDDSKSKAFPMPGSFE